MNEGPAAAAAAGASPSASWWGELSGTAQSWEEPPRRQRKLSPEEKEAWEHTRQVGHTHFGLLRTVGRGVSAWRSNVFDHQ